MAFFEKREAKRYPLQNFLQHRNPGHAELQPDLRELPEHDPDQRNHAVHHGGDEGETSHVAGQDRRTEVNHALKLSLLLVIPPTIKFDILGLKKEQIQ